MFNRDLLTWGLIAIAFTAPVAWGQCEATVFVTKTTLRPNDNIVQGKTIAWATGDYWFNYEVTDLKGELFFVPASGSATKLAEGNDSGDIVDDTSGNPANPTVAKSVFLEPQGNGNYFMRGAGDFRCKVAPGWTHTQGPEDSPWRPIERPVISGVNAIWWLGGGSDAANGLFNASTLSVNKKGATGLATWNATQGSNKISFSCTSFCTGTTVLVTSQAASAGTACPMPPDRFDIKKSRRIRRVLLRGVPVLCQ